MRFVASVKRGKIVETHSRSVREASVFAITQTLRLVLTHEDRKWRFFFRPLKWLHRSLKENVFQLPLFLFIFAGNIFRRKRAVPMAYFSYKLQRVPWKKSFRNTRCPAWSVVPVGIRVSLLFPITGVRNAAYLFFESSFFSVFFYKKKKISLHHNRKLKGTVFINFMTSYKKLSSFTFPFLSIKSHFILSVFANFLL